MSHCLDTVYLKSSQCHIVKNKTEIMCVIKTWNERAVLFVLYLALPFRICSAVVRPSIIKIRGILFKIFKSSKNNTF